LISGKQILGAVRLLAASDILPSGSIPGPGGAEMSTKVSELSSATIGIQSSLTARFAVGYFKVSEICELKQVSKSQFYLDKAAGLVVIEKFGKMSRIPGWSAAKYLGLKTPH
jgi:hypothetical protein